MNDKEIRQLLRELSDKAGEPGQVKSKTRKKKEIPQPEEKPEAAGDILDEEEAQTDTSSDREEEESEKVGIPFGRIFGKLRPSGRDLPEEDEDEPGEDEEAPVPKEKASRVIRLEGEEPDFESDADDFRSTEIMKKMLRTMLRQPAKIPKGMRRKLMISLLQSRKKKSQETQTDTMKNRIQTRVRQDPKMRKKAASRRKQGLMMNLAGVKLPKEDPSKPLRRQKRLRRLLRTGKMLSFLNKAARYL